MSTETDEEVTLRLVVALGTLAFGQLQNQTLQGMLRGDPLLCSAILADCSNAGNEALRQAKEELKHLLAIR